MGARLFHHRLAVIALLLMVPVMVAILLVKHPIGLAVCSELVGREAVFVVTGLGLWLGFLLRVSGEVRLGTIVYGQQAGGRVVTSGPFRFLRHPLYAGTAFLIVGLAAPYLPPLFVALHAVVTGLVLTAIAAHEDEAMHEKHGEAWTRYARSVPRFVGVPGPVDDDGVVTSAAGWAVAVVGNLGLFSLGAYRLAVAAGFESRALGFANLVCIAVWLLVVLARRLAKT